MKTIETLFWWRQLADVMAMTPQKWRQNWFLKFDFVTISLKNHNLVKSP